MADKWYAWSVIRVGVDQWGKAKQTFNEGDEVTAKSLDLTDDQWQELVDAGSVRTMPYPDTNGDSPVNHLHKQANALAAMEYANVVVDQSGVSVSDVVEESDKK